MTQVASAPDRYLAELERADEAWAGGAPAWLKRIREDAGDRSQSLGFPTTDDEEWRFTSVAPIAEARFVLATDGRAALGSADLAPFRLTDVASAELVFVNGRYAADLSSVRSLPRGVRIESLASALAISPGEVEPYLTRVAVIERQPFTALNTALFADGAFVHVAASVALAAPIHVLFISTADGCETMAHPRVLVVAGESSQASIVESYVSPSGDRYFTNAVTEIVVGENASVDHYKLQHEGLNAYHIGAMHMRGRRNARFQSHSVSFGDRWCATTWSQSSTVKASTAHWTGCISATGGGSSTITRPSIT